MGYFPCPICDEDRLISATPHVCDPEKIKKHVQLLEDRANIADRNLRDIQDACFMLLKELPSLDTDQVMVGTDWLKRLYKAANCQWHESKSADSFLVCWMATHHILCEAFDVFRSKKYGKVETLLEKLTNLKKACDQAKKTLGYQDSKLDMSPEKVIEPGEV